MQSIKKIIKSVFCIMLMFVGLKANATHIVGGFLSYRYISGTTYEITLKVYRDCYTQPGSNPPTEFDGTAGLPPAYIGIYQNISGGYSFEQQLELTLLSRTTISINTNPCLTPPDNVCVEEGIYKSNVTLANPNIAYTIAYGRCCRNGTISNLTPPVGDWGAAYVAVIPTTNLFHNSSPIFNTVPPSYICKDADLTYNHSATDIDGDSLVYSLCTPFTLGDPTSPTIDHSTGVGIPPYGNVTFASPYSTTDPLGGVPLSIDPTTGLLTGTPNTLGQYVVGICVSEYRNGVLIGTYLRDFQFNVSNCNNPTGTIPYISGTYDPAFGYGIFRNSCNTFNVNFSTITSYNPPPTSTPLVYHWDFGVASQTNDTANVLRPNYTYPDTGVYIATLIVTKGSSTNSCTDTVRAKVLVYPYLRSNFQNVSVCQDSSIRFTDLSSSTSVPITRWNWSFGDATTSVLQNPIKKYTTAGTYNVKLTVTNAVGCSVDTTIPVNIFPVPVANFNVSPICIFDSITINDASTGNITSYNWNFGNGNTSNLKNNKINYTNSGSIPISLIVVTDKGCRDTTTKNITVNPLPIITAANDTTICPNTNALLSASGAVSYRWTPGGVLNDSTIRNPMATVSAPTKFIVTGTDANGCKNKDSMSVSLFPQPVMNAGIDTSVCFSPGSFRDSVMLHASGTNTYNWSPAIGLTSTTIPNPVSRPTVNTTYIVGGRDTNNCYAEDSVTVFVLDPSLDLIVDTLKEICQYDTTTLNVAIQGASYYHWNPNTGINADSINSPLFFPTSTQVYTFEVRNYCYTKYDTATIVVHPLPTVGAQKIDSLCIGDTIQLHASGAQVYQWNYNLTLSDTTIANPFAFPRKDTTYYVLGIDSFGCKNRDSIKVFVFQFPVTTVLPYVPFVCQYDSVQLTAAGGVKYSWYSDPTLSDTTIYNPIAIPADTTTYFVRVTNIHNCTSLDSLTINVQLPIVPIVRTQYDTCFGIPLQLDAAGGFYYSWTPVAYLTNPYIHNPVAFPPNDTTYKVYISNDCFIDSAIVNIIFHPLPIVDAGIDTTIWRNTSGELNGSTNVGRYYWYPDDYLLHPFQLNTTASPIFTQDYILYAISEYGCINSDTVRITVEGKTILLLPTGFTPNNDGVNDIFAIAQYLNIQQLHDFSVYNRWGEKVFTTKDINKGWDGNFRGKPQELGVYTWTITAHTYDNEEINRSGNITLIR